MIGEGEVVGCRLEDPRIDAVLRFSVESHGSNLMDDLEISC